MSPIHCNGSKAMSASAVGDTITFLATSRNTSSAEGEGMGPGPHLKKKRSAAYSDNHVL